MLQILLEKLMYQSLQKLPTRLQNNILIIVASSLNSQHEGHHFGIGFSEFGGQTAMAIGLSFDFERGNFNFAISETDLMEEPAYSGGFAINF